MNRYVLNFDGTIGDFIKAWRKRKKINSIELSKEVGKSDAYISQIENNRNKKPDYDTLYKIFQKLGIEEDRIEDYLDHFGYWSPEKWEHAEAEAEAQEERQKQLYNDPSYIERELKYLNNDVVSSNRSRISNNGFDLIKEKSNEYVGEVAEVLENIVYEPSGKGFEIVSGLNKLTSEMIINKQLFNFTSKLFNSDLSRLDEQGMLKVLNTVIEETNRINKEKTAFGKPKIIKPIKSLD
ncbi:helix-turn-helix transcriptional regulator [Bacillus mojavensis]|uniref:helix-turn-helix domain-containing protein n=1 Tax=Bacillus mojavensis TaxID=72360 RepID=UPI002DBE09CB|nr:helix-turn-helix transcriptional regulator [Bacillus mojavensis]MEC1734010.1 helix-turn-helix transcriptional regulator [Bacillus mojavensis]MED1006491.1 helix-turn-helix transcriptional regulator [Bacillus mojavensis]